MASAQDVRLERLLKLLATLLDTERPISRSQIVERVAMYPADDAAIRQAFARDIKALEAMGVPVAVVGGQPPLYRVPPEAYEMPDPGLTEEEQAALHLALATVGVELPEGSSEEALWKVTGGAAQRIEAPITTAALPGHNHLSVLWRATNERRRLAFVYNGADRDVEPWALSCRGGHWYLRGYDRQRGDDRLFRLDRIEGTPSAGDAAGAFDRPSERPPAGPPPPWMLGEDVVFTASVQVDADQAAYVGGLEGVMVTDEHPDGSVVVDMPVANPAGFRTFVLGLLDHAIVLGPPEAREGIVSWLEAVAYP